MADANGPYSGVAGEPVLFDASGSTDPDATTATSDPPPDSDGVPDASDNCTLVPNPGQCDSDGDGYGNICDADFNSSGSVDFGDMAYFREVFDTVDPLADLDCSGGTVNFGDMTIFRGLFDTEPGPSCVDLPGGCAP